MRAPDPTHYVWWLAARASGLMALALVTLSVGLGLAMAGRVARRPGLPRVVMALHEQAALVGLIAIVVHGLALLADPWLHAGPVGVTVPFAMSYRPLYSGLGIISAYLAALLGLTFYLRKRIGPKRWRSVHRATILVYVLGVVHALGAGTDASTTWLRAYLVVTGLPIVVLFARRVTSARRAQPAARAGTRDGRAVSASSRRGANAAADSQATSPAAAIM